MRRSLTLGVCVCAAAVAWAGDYVMIREDAPTTSSFNSYTNWDNQLPPSAGNTYSTANYIMRTPESTKPVCIG